MYLNTITYLTIPFFLCTTARFLSNDGSPRPPSSLNESNTSLAVSNDIQIQCRGRQFGSDLDYGSCLDAFRTFTLGYSPLPVEIGRRNTGSYSHTLPWKWVSGDGKCVFDIVIRGASPLETTTGQDIARAAWKLMNECVRDQGRQGGVVSGIGADGKLGIILRSYDPKFIECGNFAQHYTANDKCNELLQTIPADISPTITWGPTGRHLPYFWQIQGNSCRLMIWGSGGQHQQTDTMSAFEIWTAGVMLAAKCARFGWAGRYPHVGKNGQLWVLLDDGRRLNMPGGVNITEGLETLETKGDETV